MADRLIMKSGTAMNLTRRQFIAASAVAPLAVGAGPASVKDSVQAQAQPFDLDSVRLIGSAQLALMELNRGFLQDLETDRLLHTFRLTAGLPSTAEPLGGWEKPDVELRGHFTGHFLSACALMSLSTGDRKSTRLNSSHLGISYAVFCL